MTDGGGRADPRLARWIGGLLSTPGLTAIRDAEEAWRLHVLDSLKALELARSFPGPLVDVGSGGGAPGLPLAAALPEREVTLLEVNARKCEFLEWAARDFPNVRVVRGRAEEQPVDRFGVAVAKALAPPPVATEWALPLVAPGGAAILYVGPNVDASAVAPVADKLGALALPVENGLLTVRKLRPTPPGFPRRRGVARKRPLG